MRFSLKFFIIFFTILIFTGCLMAQPGPPGPPGGGGNPFEPPPIPISGIEILLGAGAILGARRWIQNRKK